MCRPTIERDASVSESQAKSLLLKNAVAIGDVPSNTQLIPRPKILNNILSCVGETPLVRLNIIPQLYGVKCDILAKCEFLNPGGSIKDRTVARMIEDAESAGHIQPGDTLIEPTSGNTGIGLALACVCKCYKCIIVMPDNCSKEKEDIIRSLGGTVVRTASVPSVDPRSNFSVARQIHQETPNSYLLDQFNNASNPQIHYETTAEEILYQCDGQMDAIVAGAGTGGTISGIGQRIRETVPRCRIACVDPVGSHMSPSSSTEKRKWLVEGIGGDFVPGNLDRNLITDWIKVEDGEAFRMARDLIRYEGLLVGASAGAIVAGAVQLAKTTNPGQRIVAILPDGVRNYMTKFLDDGWMEKNNFKF